MSLYQNGDFKRLFPNVEKKSTLPPEPYRTSWRMDYARLIHSPSFRRLQGKTQLFPTDENDFFRSRLTHSMEVAQIAKSIAIRLNYNYLLPNKKPLNIDTDLVEFAALAHDLGHPPFGHIGEKALDEIMLDCGGFEGNAQTLRILTKIEKKFLLKDSSGFLQCGLNLTSRALASILKYDKVIKYNRKPTKNSKIDINSIEPFKGYYFTEKDLVRKIKNNVIGPKTYKDDFKTIECQIMDIADDIAYSTYDLEDTFKAGFMNIFDILYSIDKIIDNITFKVNKKFQKEYNIKIDKDLVKKIINTLFSEIFDFKKFKANDILVNILDEKNILNAFKFFTGVSYNSAKQITEESHYRTIFTSRMVGSFIRGVEFKYNNRYPSQSKVFLNQQTLLEIEVIKRLIYESQVLSARIKITEIRGKEIVREIFKYLTNLNGDELLPPDYRELYEMSNKNDKKRIICDFIAGMTDRYAIEFYGRLKSEDPQTIFKPF